MWNMYEKFTWHNSHGKKLQSTGRSIELGYKETMKLYNKIELIELSKVKPYFNNPRNNAKAIAALVKIIPQVGFNVPLVVDKDFVIIKGHSRYHAARLLGMDKVPCIISEGTPEANKADRVTDNAINDMSEWNNEKLSIELRELDLNYRDLFPLKEYGKYMELDDSLVVQDDFKYAKNTEEGRKSLLQITCPKCGEDLLISPDELKRKLEISDKLELSKE
jgi:ParB family chromosome partitioning protein